MPNNSYKETLSNDTTFEMIQVEGGSFLMGNNETDALDREQPIHQVNLEGFYIGKFPVTQAFWISIMGIDNNPSNFKGDNRPVENISQDDVLQFIQQLNRLTNKTYRLPTEAEWEYAARGGQKSQGYQYAGNNCIEHVAWFCENSGSESKPVGLKQPNELGLFDMSGNVYEWCWDWFEETYYQTCQHEGIVKNPKGVDKGTYRIFRGGCWKYDKVRCRVSYRHHDRPWRPYPYLGVRLVVG